MIEKITVENLCIEDYYGSSILIQDKQTIIDKAIPFSIHKEEDYPGVVLLERLFHIRPLTEKIFGVSNNSKGYGYIKMEFNQPHFPNRHFNYVQQFMDSTPYFETLAIENSIISMNYSGELYLKNRNKNLGDLDITLLANTLLARYYIYASSSECTWLREDFGKAVYKDTHYFSFSDLKILKPWGRRETVSDIVDTYNYYLKRLGFNKYIRSQNDSYFMTKSLNDFTVEGFEVTYYHHPLSSEGGGFIRILNIIDAIEEAKLFSYPLFIRNFGYGIDKNVSKIFEDIIKEESGKGKSIPYSVLVVE